MKKFWDYYSGRVTYDSSSPEDYQPKIPTIDEIINKQCEFYDRRYNQPELKILLEEITYQFKRDVIDWICRKPPVTWKGCRQVFSKNEIEKGKFVPVPNYIEEMTNWCMDKWGKPGLWEETYATGDWLSYPDFLFRDVEMMKEFHNYWHNRKTCDIPHEYRIYFVYSPEAIVEKFEKGECRYFENAPIYRTFGLHTLFEENRTRDEIDKFKALMQEPREETDEAGIREPRLPGPTP